ncbi:MAG TPA: zinc-dependent alcohol dehydrogenase family protein, partial [Polyangiales bacterium]|nr:zinc-dependent alcohol dehydrogenase family protein [Polyangiales bacterium]
TDARDTVVLAMVLERAGQGLQRRELPEPKLGPGQVLLEVAACGICRTDLHILDGELEQPVLPLVLGHQIVGRVLDIAAGVERFARGQRVGVPWLGWACGVCSYCRQGRENLCGQARFTGYQLPGGYAQLTAADAAFCLALPDAYSDAAAAPLLCAGLIGYRALRMAGDARRLGLYGIGSAAHIVAQVAVHQGREVYAFTRPGDGASQAFARALGAVWAGGSDQRPDVELDAAILFAPVGALVPAALEASARGGRVVCAGIHMSDIPSFPYELLWGERSLCSVANLTRRDGDEFMRIAPEARVHTEITTFALDEASSALEALRAGRFQGSGVLLCR